MGRDVLVNRRVLAGWLVAGVCVSVAVLTWFGSRALANWRQSSVQLLERRSDEAARLLVTALMRDMHAVQQSAMLSASWEDYARDAQSALTDAVASTFARYPYPESVFLWRTDDEAVRFYARSNRLPGWWRAPHESSRFPVTTFYSEAVATQLTKWLRKDAAGGARFVAFETQIEGADCQVVARLYYADPFGERLTGALGFVVNLRWVREFYFADMVKQMAQIGDRFSGVSLEILDPGGSVISRSSESAASAQGVSAQTPFDLVFFDPRLIAAYRFDGLRPERWSVRVSAEPDPPLATALRNARWVLIVASLAAMSLAVGLLQTVRAVRASARLAQLRSDFVATVTHELKAPIATIRVIGDTWLSGRVTDAAARMDYARIVVQEAKRLTRLVDNLLALSRITDVANVYSFKSVSVRDIVDDALQSFRQQLIEGGFAVCLDVPPELPEIHADATAVHLMLDNVIHNAIRYSERVCSICISATVEGNRVKLAIADRGRGIPEDELPKVTRKFFRGRRVLPGGSGLGMAIVKRVVDDHGGELEIQSVVDAGTTVIIALPIAEDDHAKAHSRS